MPSVQNHIEGGDAVAGALDVTSAARYLGVSASYLNRLRSSGGGPTFIKLGARVSYRLRDLDLWQEQHARSSTADTGKAA